MELLRGKYTLRLPQGAFPLSTDSIALADFVRLPRQAKVLDFGSGCGTLGLLLCAKDPGCHVTGIELDPRAHESALENIRRNGLDTRMESICADLRSVSERFSPGSFSCCVSNPPYFSGGESSLAVPMARRDDYCSPAQLFHAAAWALQYGGDFYLVHKPEKLAQLCACASKAGLEPKRLRLIRCKPDSPVTLILLQCRKGGKHGLTWEEACLYDQNEEPTPYYRSLYHL